MYGFVKSPDFRKDALHKLFALAFTSALAGLLSFGAFAIGSAVGDSTAVGIAFATLAFLSLFLPLLTMLSVPNEGTKALGEKASSLQKVFSALF